MSPAAGRPGKHATRFVDWKGTRILEIHFAGLAEAEMLVAIDEVRTTVQREPAKSVRSLTFVANAKFDKRVSDALKQLVKDDEPYVLRSAVVGLSPLQNALLTGIRILTKRDLRGFLEVDAARDWLAEA